MNKGLCVGCEKQGLLATVTGRSSVGEVGLCDSCFAIPEPRFHKTEKRISKLTEAILGKI